MMSGRSNLSSSLWNWTKPSNSVVTSRFADLDLYAFSLCFYLGYRVLKCLEVYHYESRSKFCAETGTSGLFSEYIDCFLKLKQEKSGWPSWVKTDEDADRYILEYEKREGIRLNPKEIEKNAGLRAIAKV